MSQRVVILGGGVAGLAAAMAHHEDGWSVHLVEARSWLGGRAWSHSKGGHGPDLDNGPHVILGCYHAFRRLLVGLGSEQLFDQATVLRLSFLSEGGRIQRLAPPALPAPLHLAAGLLRIEGLSLADRLGMLKTAIRPFLPLPSAHESLGDWMQRKRVGDAARSLLITPLCRAILNVEPGEASARLFLATLREAFFGGRRHSGLWAPKASWSEILDRPAQALFARSGLRLSLENPALALEAREGGCPSVRLRDGTLLEDHDRVVLALPWNVTHKLLIQGGVVDAEDQGTGGGIQPAPILTVHLDLPEGSLPFDDAVMGLVDGSPFHFVVRRSGDQGRAQPGAWTGMLAGAAFGLDGLQASEIVDIALDQLRGFVGRQEPWPNQVRDTARVVRESGATIRALPGIEKLRPRPGTEIAPGLLLCGDWTDTGLPSTLEGAARSGYALPTGPTTEKT